VRLTYDVSHRESASLIPCGLNCSHPDDVMSFTARFCSGHILVKTITIYGRLIWKTQQSLFYCKGDEILDIQIDLGLCSFLQAYNWLCCSPDFIIDDGMISVWLASELTVWK